MAALRSRMDNRLVFPNGLMPLDTYTAAVCFKNAGKVAQEKARYLYQLSKKEPTTNWQQSYIEAAAHFEQALKLLHKVDQSNPLYSTKQCALLQEEIATISSAQWHVYHVLGSTKEAKMMRSAFTEMRKAADLWGKLAEDKDSDKDDQVIYLVKQANALAGAAHFAPTLKETSELYAQAVLSSKQAWSRDSGLCLSLSEFSGIHGNENLIEYLEQAAQKSRKMYVDAVMQKKASEQFSFISTISKAIGRLFGWA